MKIKLSILAVLILTPIWLCLLFAVLPIGSIGPAVLLTWAVNSVLLPLAFRSVFKEIRDEKRRKKLVASSIPVGLLLAYLQFISYMPLTEWFGLDDFYWI